MQSCCTAVCSCLGRLPKLDMTLMVMLKTHAVGCQNPNFSKRGSAPHPGRGAAPNPAGAPPQTPAGAVPQTPPRVANPGVD